MHVRLLKRHENSIVVEIGIPDGVFCKDCPMRGDVCRMYDDPLHIELDVDSMRSGWHKCSACLEDT